MFVIPAKHSELQTTIYSQMAWQMSIPKMSKLGFCLESLFETFSERFRNDPSNTGLRCTHGGSGLLLYYNVVLVFAGHHFVLGGAIDDVWADSVRVSIELPLTYRQLIPRKVTNVHSTTKRPNSTRRRKPTR